MPYPTPQQAAAALARATYRRDPAGIRAARAALAAAKIEQAITRALADAPPLSRTQRERLAELLGVRR